MVISFLPSLVTIAIILIFSDEATAQCTSLTLTSPGQASTLETPNYPSAYPKNLDLCYTISSSVTNATAAQAYFTMVTFDDVKMDRTEFELFGFPINFCNDYIQMSFTDIQNNKQDFKDTTNICKMPDDDVFLSQQNFEIKIKSFANAGSATGFQMGYESIGLPNDGSKSKYSTTEVYKLTAPDLKYMIRSSYYPDNRIYSSVETFTIYIDPSLSQSDYYIQFTVAHLNGKLSIYDSDKAGEDLLYSAETRQEDVKKTACKSTVTIDYKPKSFAQSSGGFLVLAKLVPRSSTTCGVEPMNAGVIIGIVVGVILAILLIIGCIVMCVQCSKPSKPKGGSVITPGHANRAVYPQQNQVQTNVFIQNQAMQGQPMQWQVMQGQPMVGQQMQWQQMPGQPIQGQAFQGQPMQGQPMQGQAFQGQPMQGQPMQGQPMQGQPIQVQSSQVQPPSYSSAPPEAKPSSNSGDVPAAPAYYEPVVQ